MKKYKIYYDQKENKVLVGDKDAEKDPSKIYLCTASLEEIEDEIYKRERVNLEYRFRFKKLGIDRLDDIAKLLEKHVLI